MPVAEAIRNWSWAYPLLSTLHIAGFGLLFGSIAVVDVAFLSRKAARVYAMRKLCSLILPWSAIGFFIACVSGGLMFLADAVAVAANPAFQVKLSLILLAGLNAALLHLSPAWPWFSYDRSVVPSRLRLAAIASASLWLMAIAAGRMIAFV